MSQFQSRHASEYDIAPTNEAEERIGTFIHKNDGSSLTLQELRVGFGRCNGSKYLIVFPYFSNMKI